MSGLEEKLEGILSNPSAMEQIMALARSLGQQPQAGPDQGSGPPPAPPPPPPPAQGGLSDLLGQLDPRLLSGAVQLMGEYQRGDDKRTALLQALRPFVGEKRYARLDKAIQIAKLSRLARMALTLLRPREDTPHV